MMHFPKHIPNLKTINGKNEALSKRSSLVDASFQKEPSKFQDFRD